jgi:hypothetical protein
VSRVDAASIHVWRQPDKLWRWRWVERDDSGEELTSIVSHMAFDSSSEAESSAHEAYPGVVVHLPGDVDDAPQQRPRRWLLVLVTAAAVAAVAHRARHRGRPSSG